MPWRPATCAACWSITPASAARRSGAGRINRSRSRDDLAIERPAEILILDEALEHLAGFDERKARAVELHYFGGMSHEEIATALAVHPNTVARDLRMGEAWLQRYITDKE